MNVMIAGATGLVGQLVLAGLIAEPKVNKVVALNRRALAISSDKVVEYRFTHFTEWSQFGFDDGKALDVEVAFCCLGSTMKKAGTPEQFKAVDLAGVEAMVRLGERLKVKTLVLISAAGADANSIIFYNRVKGLAEQAALQSQIPNVIVFRPGLLLAERSEVRRGELLAVKTVLGFQKIFPGLSLKKWATSPFVLARAMTTAGLASEGRGHKIIEADSIL